MSPLPVFGMPSNPMMQQMGQQGSQPWTIVTELKNDFNVKRVGMDVDKIDDDIKLLLVIAPKDISDKAQYAIDQFIMRGGKLVAFLDAAMPGRQPPAKPDDGPTWAAAAPRWTSCSRPGAFSSTPARSWPT